MAFQWAIALSSGAAGVLVGAIVTYLLQGVRDKRAARSASRIVYSEILANIATLNTAVSNTKGPVILSYSAWNQHAPALAALLDEVDVFAISGPYQAEELFRRVLTDQGMESVRRRLTREHDKTVLSLLNQFKDAEQRLRPKVWSRKRSKALAAVQPLTPKPEPMRRRVVAILRSPPVSTYLMGAWLVLLMQRWLEALMRSRRR